FRPRIQTDFEGIWTLNSYTAYRILNFVNSEQTKTITKSFAVAAAPECSTSAQCGGTTTSCECANNACVQCPFGFTCQAGRCQSSSTCLGTTNSCYSNGNICV